MSNGSGYVRRPLLLMGAAFFVTVWFLISYSQKFFAIYLLIALPLCGFGLIYVHKKRISVLVVMVLTVLCAVLCFIKSELCYLSAGTSLAGNNRTVVGRIYEAEEYEYGSKCVFKLESVDGKSVNYRASVVLLNIAPEYLRFYERTTFKADISDLNSLEQDQITSLRSENIFISAQSKAYDLKYLTKSKFDILSHIYRIKTSISKAVTDFIPNNCGRLILSFVLGEKSGLSRSVREQFKVCGLSHLMAVSGLHIYTWSYAIFICLKNLASRRNVSIVLIAFTLFFMALTGFTPSVVRAGIMMLFVYIGYIFMKSPDSLNSLGGALLIMCAVNPFVVKSVSFQLSFSAAFGLSLMSEKISKIEIYFSRLPLLSKFAEFVCRTSAVCVSATLFALPATVFSFGKLSLINIAANLLCVNISMFIMVLGGTGAVAALINYTGELGLILILSAAFLSKLILDIVKFLSGFDFLYIDVNYLGVKVCVAALVITALLIYALWPKLYKNKVIIAFIAVNVSALSYFFTSLYCLLKEVE